MEAKAMGDAVMSRWNTGWQRRVATACLVLAMATSCTSSKPAHVVDANPAPDQAPGATSGSAKASTATATGPVEIRALDLREGAPEVFVDLEASAPLVWTSFRNPEGRVVIELPNAVPAAKVQDVTPDDGLIASVKVQRETEGLRPMTRLVIATRHEVEHSVTADGNHLQIRLLPLDTQAQAGARPAGDSGKQKLAFDPVPASAPPPSAAADTAPAAPAAPVTRPAPAPVTAATDTLPRQAGTPDQPAVAPAPGGTPATRLESIEVLASQGPGTVIRLTGDGEFPYATFALADPNRFVIDLQGVVNRSSRSTVALSGGVVNRVRVAQFKPGPKGVARVVFDLKQGAVPRIERTGDALVVTFGDATAAAAAPAPAPAPVQMAAAAPPPADSTPPPPPPSVSRKKTRKVAPALTPGDNSTPPPPTTPTAPTDLAVAPGAGPSAAPAPPALMASARHQPGIDVEDAAPTPAKSKATGGGIPRVAPTPTSLQQPSADLGRKQDDPKLAGDITGTQHAYTGEPIDLKVTNADVTEVLRTFAQISGLNIVVQPGVGGSVTAELENVPWDQAFEEVLKINNLGYEREGNVIRIAPNSVLRDEARERQQLAAARALVIPLRTVMRRLSYASASNVATLLRSGQAGLLTQRGSVVVDERTNTLIIKELPDFLDAVLAVISNLDTPEPQVMIEARVIETTKTFSRSLGINWGFNAIADAAHGNTTGLIFPNNVTASGSVALSQPANGQLNLTLGNVLNTFSLDLALQAAESEGLVNILAAPKVATLNNESAYIESGLQIPIQTVANNTITVQFVNATLRLDVTPQVTAEGTVIMDLTVSDKTPENGLLVPGATNAPIQTKDAKTRLVVRDGGTAVIGGIYKVTTDANEARVPGLANLPIIGYLFRNKERDQTNDELLIFITPRVIKI
jgi:type IV pilus assembly protein PilQ